MENLTSWRDDMLAKIEHNLKKILITQSSCPTLLEAMRYSTLDGGKRIRPLFTLAAGSLNQAQSSNTLIIGCAIELIHCFSLIHDDLPCMDNDDLRRGRPTNHKVFGDAIALLTGDALHALCFEVLSSATLDLPAEIKLKIINLISRAIGLEGMVGGQSIDWLSTSKKLSHADLQHMHSLKTGALIHAAILSGYLAGVNFNAEQYQELSQIGKNIGLLFQIIDDIIDFTEDTLTLGKTANKDNIQNKATYVNVLGLNKAKAIAAELHTNILEKLALHQASSQLQFLANCIYYRNC